MRLLIILSGFVLLIGVVLFLGLTEGKGLGVSPPSMSFEIVNMSEICKYAYAFSKDNESEIVINSRNFNGFNLNYMFVDKIGKISKFELCINSSIEGRHKGEIIFKDNKGMIEIAYPLKVNVDFNDKKTGITGFGVFEGLSKHGNLKDLMYIEGIFLLFVLLAFIFIIFRAERGKIREKNKKKN